MANNTVACAWMKLINTSFLCKKNNITAFLNLGTQDRPSALFLGAILNSIITNKKQKNVKKLGTT